MKYLNFAVVCDSQIRHYPADLRPKGLCIHLQVSPATYIDLHGVPVLQQKVRNGRHIPYSLTLAVLLLQSLDLDIEINLACVMNT